MNVGSTFSGVGGLDLGLERAGMRVLWQAEVDEWCRRVLRWHWPDADIFDDVRAVSADGLHREHGRRGTHQHRGGDAAQRPKRHQLDLLCGGFPCQDLSVAGKRAGLAGERSGLFFEFARIADELRPTWLLVENVVGLLSSANGRDMGVVLSTLAEIGYGLSWRVVDARYFGVPQRRRRVFIVGCLGDDGERAVRALGAGGEGDLEAGRCSWQDAAAGTGAGTQRAGGVRWPAEVAPTLNTAFGTKMGLEDQHALSGAGMFVPGPITFEAEYSNQGKVTEAGAPSGPLTRSLRKATLHQSSVRRLTPTECERLMSWPDGWTAVDGDKTPDSRRYAACGNGVVSNVAEWIGRRIMAVEREG